MAFTPAHLAQARGCGKSELLKTAELIRIRKLYLEKRYKKCIAACEENLGLNLHPVHKAFLLFQQAISYEALGLAAHNYSRTKIPFLQSAKDKFEAEIEILPQPFTNGESGQYQTPVPSPLIADFPDSGEHLPIMPTPWIRITEEGENQSDTSSEYSSTEASIAFTVPDCDRHSLRSDLLSALRFIPRTVTFPDINKQDQTSAAETEAGDEGDDGGERRDPMHVARLSASLSSAHVLSDGLVPSPLFSRTKKLAKIPFPRPKVSIDAPTTPETRALPPTPYAYHTRRTLFQVRKTAIQTLMSRHEGNLPSDCLLSSPTPPSIYTDATPPQTATTTHTYAATPATSRFTAIASFFTPQPINSHLDTFLSSSSLARYNDALASFRTAILSAISATSTAIETTNRIQKEHEEEKRRAFLTQAHDKSACGKRLASYWLLSMPVRCPTGSMLRGVDRAQAKEENQKLTKIKERIEKLREGGFHVRKERYGWKGAEYYDDLRRMVESELHV